MYISKNELVSRLVEITGKSRSEFIFKRVVELNEILKKYDLKEKCTYLEVPYKNKKIVKLLGAKYDGDIKKWYVPQGVKIELFDRWIKTTSV